MKKILLALLKLQDEKHISGESFKEIGAAVQDIALTIQGEKALSYGRFLKYSLHNSYSRSLRNLRDMGFVVNVSTERGWRSTGYRGDSGFLRWGLTVEGLEEAQSIRKEREKLIQTWLPLVAPEKEK